ncbi:Os11g0305600 [Oryza sativa Japonica Group]|uniref:Os11g0305600 protein n=1 Tax=Oryza sativa subsp. japonica TaxID=39947 RepID=A0A0N7KST4_ORYSJ|nr:Os11g0305600 [Oryza sativa Japonica Group]
MTILHRVAEALPSSAHLRRLIIISRPPEKAIVMLPSQSVPKITRVAEDRIYLVLHCYDVAKTSGVLTLLVATYALRHHQHLLNLCNTGVPLLGAHTLSSSSPAHDAFTSSRRSAMVWCPHAVLPERAMDCRSTRGSTSPSCSRL